MPHPILPISQNLILFYAQGDTCASAQARRRLRRGAGPRRRRQGEAQGGRAPRGALRVLLSIAQAAVHVTWRIWRDTGVTAKALPCRSMTCTRTCAYVHMCPCCLRAKIKIASTSSGIRGSVWTLCGFPNALGYMSNRRRAYAVYITYTLALTLFL